jgi:3-hydroxyisobutyrate dehydrogenase-like beta-hydroxyacid dehydrogenase
MLTAAERLGMALPLTSTHRKLLESAEEIGCGPLDNSAIIQVYEQLRGAIHDR